MLKALFISEVRIKILDLLLKKPDEDLHVRAIVRKVGAEINAVRRELENLTKIHLLSKRQSSNRLYYSVNTSHLFYPELLALLSKEKGLGADIIKYEKELGDVEFAIISKPFLRGKPSTQLDVDLFLVGDIKMGVLSQIIGDFEKSHRREINYSVMSSEEFKFRKRKSDQFIIKILVQSKTMLIGDEDKFHSII
jgi:DNA-binding transcriptional ArsR family regulator